VHLYLLIYIQLSPRSAESVVLIQFEGVIKCYLVEPLCLIGKSRDIGRKRHSIHFPEHINCSTPWSFIVLNLNFEYGNPSIYIIDVNLTWVTVPVQRWKVSNQQGRVLLLLFYDVVLSSGMEDLQEQRQTYSWEWRLGMFSGGRNRDKCWKVRIARRPVKS